MTEALVNHFLGDKWQAYSAGTAPSSVNPRVKRIMTEIGIDISSSYSKSVDEFVNSDDLDLVITVCNNARESCPVFPNNVEQIHIGFDDPAIYTEFTDDAALPAFRKIRDEIKERLLGELRKRL